MSSTSSILLGYENNNDVNRSKMKRPTVVPTGSSATSKNRPWCSRIHLNSLWSLWYGFFGTILQAYVGVKCTKRILGYSLLPWPDASSIPVLELNTSLALTGLAVLFLPFFLASAAFKIGNLANDGFKLGLQLSTCSKEPPSELLGTSGGCSLWKHGGPTAPFLHLVIAFCLLLPKLLMEARLIEAGLIPQEAVWHTDLDFMMVHKDRLVVLSFMTAPNNSALTHPIPSALPIITSSDDGSASLQSIKDGNEPHALPFTRNIVGGLRKLLDHDSHKSVKDGNEPHALPFTNNIVKGLRSLIGHDNQVNSHSYNPDTGWGISVSLEYMNFALALLVYSVRYSAIFWGTNKCMGITFSFQMLINGIQTLFAYSGMSVLYKVEILGAWKALPLLKPQPGGMSPLGGVSPFLLNPQVTLALYILSSLLVLSSSLVLYLYGHTRFNAFLNQERERKIIVFKEGTTTSKWGYFTHCAALCVLVSISVCNAPLLHDYIVVYKGSLDGTVLSCVIGSILHLFIWVTIWLFLTIKQKWIFKLRVTVGRATVRQARSVKLVTDVDLMTHHSEDPSLQPLLVVGNGRTYSISDTSPKKAIMGIIQKATMTKKSEDGSAASDDGEEQIYWLRPALVTPKSSPDGSKQLCWFNKKPKQVTFKETSSTSVARNKGGRRLPGMEVDDGDYATLRELPLPPPPPSDAGEDTASEEGKLLACVHDEHVTYASTSQDLVPPVDYEDPSPLLTPEPLSDRDDASKETSAVIVHNQTQITAGQTPRCLRRADSGMPHDELTPRSDSVSTESPSPPDQPGSNHSESSSGVHSNESSEHHHNNIHLQPLTQQTRRATSIADLAQSSIKEEVQWRSCSLQRNVQPPTSTSHFSPSYVFPGSPPSASLNGEDHGIPAVILENPSESTVVIRRKQVRPKTNEIGQTPAIKEEPFGRATNMRMTSFTENSDLKGMQISSATLPHYPTQPVPVPNVYPHCSTMPLPQQHNCNVTASNLGTGNSCNIYPRMHTTIPTHHNGVRLFNGAPTPNPYIKRLQYQNVQTNPVRLNSNEPIYTGINRVSGEIYHYNS